MIQGAILLDPYATAIISRRTFGELGPVCLLLSRAYKGSYAALREALYASNVMQWHPWHALKLSSSIPRIVSILLAHSIVWDEPVFSDVR